MYFPHKDFFKVSKSYKSWTKPITYIVNHNISNLDLKQTFIWKSYKKRKVQDSVLASDNQIKEKK